MGINRQIRFTTAGTNESVSQAFYNNYYADSFPVATNFFEFNTPMYYTYGGTLNYYSQDPYAIFTNTARPPIRFVFTANTSSLSGDSYFVHEIYKLDYEAFKLFSDNQNTQELDILNDVKKDNNSTLGSGLNSRMLSNKNSIRFGNNKIPLPEKSFGSPLTTKDLSTIQAYFSTPITILTASTSAVTGYIYDLFIPQYVKQSGNFQDELFTDKSQFFINTKIVFNANLGRTYSDFYQLGSSGVIPSGWSNSLLIQTTNASAHTINTGPFSGINVAGNFFSYFIVPDKPTLEYPIMSGQLSTFTPEFRWSNGDKADSFVVQINYNTSDSGFTGVTYNYTVPKEERFLQVSNNKTIGPDSEYSSNKNIYTYQVPIKSRSSFIYRVGNAKELVDIFDVKRTVVTYSESYTATTQPQRTQIYVNTKSDSKSMEAIGVFEMPPSLDYESPIDTYTLSGTVSGSIVTGATLSLLCPNSNFITTMTDVVGGYSFTDLQEGDYVLTTIYRGYEQDVRNITISGDTSLGFKIKLLWDNNYDTWGKMASENYYL